MKHQRLRMARLCGAQGHTSEMEELLEKAKSQQLWQQDWKDGQQNRCERPQLDDSTAPARKAEQVAEDGCKKNRQDPISIR